jgi:hypothetical protein
LRYYSGLVLYGAHPLATGAVVAFRLKSVYIPSGQPSSVLWLVDVMRVETRGREEVCVTQDAIYEYELERMRVTPP